ncbi:hypothetical protein PAXRUDRAFT_143064 [Paxillus rubicundulus Ve08.2h10]|uniref:Uncharacterized protein n=1 Tax=Paxillus rubicundulus Ve08.2h10 TaxID=930991 RepID=A0A0D0DB41_9AGAM|nr:hypothetical protein PAXRUDRAFT_143064 [Paxillus rubicundulus Ve08.2h10]
MQILTPVQEEVLSGWCKLQSSAANPLHPSKLWEHVKDIMGQLPSRNWHYLFLHWHKTLLSSHPNGLDPKHAHIVLLQLQAAIFYLIHFTTDL